MLEWLLKRVLGTTATYKILRTKMMSVAAAIAAWFAVNTALKDESGVTQIVSGILIGILDLAFMWFHTAMDKKALEKER